MSLQGIGGSMSVQIGSVATLIGNGDTESVLLAFGVERAQNMSDAVKAKIGDMRARNEAINGLRSAISELRTSEADMDPETVKSAEQLNSVGQQMENWGSVGGRSWMAPDFKDVLDAHGIPHKASNMSKASMSVNGDGTGGWHVSYPTSEYHQLGRDVQAKAETILNGDDPAHPPTIDLDKPMANGKTLAEMLHASGVPMPLGDDGKPLTRITEDQAKTLMQNLETEIDRMTSNDQLDMITLQSMVSKGNNALEMLSNLCAKYANLNDKICGNMR